MNIPDLMALLRSLNIAQLRERNGNITGCCPNHAERRPSWGIRTEAPYVHGCFACGFKGTLSSLLLGQYQWRLSEVEKLLGVRSLQEGTKDTTGFSLVTEKEEMTYHDPSMLYAFKRTTRMRTFLFQRGILEQTIQMANLLFHEENHRIIFPWYHGQKLIGATGRTVLSRPGIPKIIAYLEMRKGKFFYLPSRMFLPKYPLILVEGEIDALKVMQAGYPNVAAIAFGAFSKKQHELIQTWAPKQIVLFLDHDDTGFRNTKIIKALLETEFRVHVVEYGNLVLNLHRQKLDPGDLTSKQIKSLIEAALKRSSDWLKF